MSGDADTGAGAGGIAAGDQPRTTTMRQWRSSASKPKLPSDQAARQGAIARLAFELLGGRDGALAYLNGEDAVLGGRPLDLATATKAGFAAVEDAIRLKAGG